MTQQLDNDTRIALLERMFVQQTEVISQRLGNIERVLHEVHDKMDTHILSQAIINTKLEAKHENQELAIRHLNTEVDKTNGKILRTGGFIATLITAMVTGAFELLKK